MKSLIKLIASLTFTMTPALTVVACGPETNETSPEDILHEAVNTINSTTVNAAAQLNLDKDAKNLLGSMAGRKFTDLDADIQSKIATFFANQVTQNSDDYPTTWYHPSAKISINDGSVFTIPYSQFVYGQIGLKASISYGNLKAVTKDITLTIDNDTNESTPFKKVQEIKTFVTNQIVNDINVPVETLPVSGDLTTHGTNIAQQLRTVQQNLHAQLQELINYDGIIINFTPDETAGDKNTFFTLKAPDALSGTINNFDINFLAGAGASAQVTLKTSDIPQKIKINQNIDDANSQISKEFKSLTLTVDTLPTAEEKYEEYIKTNPNLEKQILEENYFARINAVYTTSVLGFDWNATKIVIENKKDAVFSNNAGSKFTGHFNLSFKINYEIMGDKSKTINVNVQDVIITLNKK